ncbi:hypothetical protein [Sabulicella glaciei]|uniref:Uncharacterized protein n=1 Tax=Sabulicella glaciei TaxID=2984948 RepID=A0ABT3NSH2_9PROT|nr:hypothetical protein [Roseococcus sp. MDT2-1-1]MCW8085109.1 hypothetical protein [Roseococcus sp. MDT2-1-1]
MGEKRTRIGGTMRRHPMDGSAGAEPRPVQQDWLTDLLTRVKLPACLLLGLGLLLLMVA